MQHVLSTLLPDSPPTLRESGSSANCSTTDGDDERIGFTHVRREKRWSQRLRRSLTSRPRRNAYSVSDLATMTQRQTRTVSSPSPVREKEYDADAVQTTAVNQTRSATRPAISVWTRVRQMICCWNMSSPENQPIATIPTNNYQAI
jgi:hypothetical protein